MLRNKITFLDRYTKSRSAQIHNTILPKRPPLVFDNPRISHQLKAIFIHVPKTAGTSITSALNTISRRAPDVAYRPMLLRNAKHMRATKLRDVVGKRVWNSYFKFAFVRNPWDLMVSSYNWWRQSAYEWDWLQTEVRQIDRLGGFEGFMHSVYGRDMINQFHGSMYDWISDGDELIVDFVGRFESLDEDWAHVCGQLGVEPTVLPHLNQTTRHEYGPYYTDETRDFVAQRFRHEIAMFNYKFVSGQPVIATATNKLIG